MGLPTACSPGAPAAFPQGGDKVPAPRARTGQSTGGMGAHVRGLLLLLLIMTIITDDPTAALNLQPLVVWP